MSSIMIRGVLLVWILIAASKNVSASAEYIATGSNPNDQQNARNYEVVLMNGTQTNNAENQKNEEKAEKIQMQNQKGESAESNMTSSRVDASGNVRKSFDQRKLDVLKEFLTKLQPEQEEEDRQLYEKRKLLKQHLMIFLKKLVQDQPLSKRFMYDVESKRWDKAIVPYVLDSSLSEKQVNEIRKTIALYEYWTCFRFPEWNSTTKSTYGLSHNNYVLFVNGNGCWSYVGNLRKAFGGQKASCCGGAACAHEIGHALGFHHEQRLPWQGEVLRINHANINPAYLGQYLKSNNEENLHRHFPYNLNSYMHYQFWMFRKSGVKGDTMTVLDPRLRYLVNHQDPQQFYMFKEASELYQCKELKCPSFKMKCENDGYVSYIENKCRCRCPKGLNHETGCTTLSRENDLDQKMLWPNSNFSMLRPLDTQCPENSTAGSLTHTSDGGWTSYGYKAMGNYETLHFCTFDHANRTAAAKHWPKGEYCITTVGGQCPEKDCPEGWTFNENNKHCYKIFSDKVRGYEKGRTLCRQHNAEVVIIDDASENSFVNNMRHRSILLGINDKNKEGTWIRDDGLTATYTNWASNQPDDWYNEDCAVMTTYGQWNDLDCNSWFTVMCEQPFPEFKEGTIEFEDETLATKGVLPDVVEGQKTKLDFCCRKDGNRADPIILPIAQKFILWQMNPQGCQVVKDTFVESHFFAYKLKGSKTVERNGTTPVFYMQNNVAFVYFCFYQPISRDCGEIIELTDCSSEKTVFSPYYPHHYHANMECTWIIKSPPNSRIVLEFERFEVPSQSKMCEDSLEIRFNLLEQPGVKYCGYGFKSSIISNKNYMSLILDSKSYEKGKLFKARVRMVQDGDLCYYAKDYGLTYRGTVNFSRSFKICLPWANTTHCVHSPNNKLDKDNDLIENYCRNPDSGTHPWCYTDSEKCGRDYCDVCGVEKCNDILDNCGDLIKSNSNYCSDTTAWKGEVKCAKSCGFCDRQSKAKAVDTICSSPPYPTYAIPVNSSLSSVHVGLSTRYKFNNSNYNTFKLTCLSDKTWTRTKDCPEGWTIDSAETNCIKAIKQSFLGRYEGDRLCEKYGGYAATILDQDQQDLVQKLVKEAGKNMIIGLDDKTKEGTFIWSNGKNVTYSNYNQGEPNNWYNEDCVEMKTNGKWNDIDCHRNFNGIVCQIDIPVGTCKDGTFDCEKFRTVTDVAPGKQASQSSDYRSQYGANNALNNDWNMGTGCTHTKTENNPWWKVNLESVYKIQKVVLVNRQKSWGSRLKNVIVTIGKTDQDMNTCATYEGPGTTGELVELYCSSAIDGQYVQVQIQGNGILTLCQVMIYAYN